MISQKKLENEKNNDLPEDFNSLIPNHLGFITSERIVSFDDLRTVRVIDYDGPIEVEDKFLYYIVVDLVESVVPFRINLPFFSLKLTRLESYPDGRFIMYYSCLTKHKVQWK